MSVLRRTEMEVIMKNSELNQRSKRIAWQGLPAAIATGLLAMTLAPSVLAQSEQDEADEATMLEEVIVTATSREESLMEVPIAVTAISDRKSVV